MIVELYNLDLLPRENLKSKFTGKFVFFKMMKKKT